MMHLLRVGLLLIPGFSLGKEIEECCKRKIVGDDIYNFIKQVGEAKSEFGCMNDCVYSIEGKPDSMFCFRSGDQRAVCQDSSDSTDSTDSTGSTDLTDLTDECFIDENTDYPGMDLNPETGRTTDRRDSALACRDLCNQNKDCKYFGWKAHSRECWLKTGISKKVVQSGTTSGTACRTGSKTIAATCDDEISVYFDGEKALEGNSPFTVYTAAVPAATKVIGIACKDIGGHYGLVASTDNGIVTDDTR